MKVNELIKALADFSHNDEVFIDCGDFMWSIEQVDGSPPFSGNHRVYLTFDASNVTITPQETK